MVDEKGEVPAFSVDFQVKEEAKKFDQIMDAIEAEDALQFNEQKLAV